MPYLHKNIDNRSATIERITTIAINVESRESFLRLVSKKIKGKIPEMNEK
jgi:hypothetical protein